MLDKPILTYFLKFFPKRSLSNAVTYTNIEIRNGHHGAETSAGEILKYLGIRLHMSLEPIKSGIDQYFNKDIIDGTVLQGKDFDKLHGMSYSRFKKITQCFRLSEKAHITPDMVRIH
jgi:hypothetical protein